jgi:protein disulfide-isomerase
MKNMLLYLSLLLASLMGLELSAVQISWLTNYEEAVNQGKSGNKPVILFFTGSDWCGWCSRLEEEVLDTPEFAAQTADKYIFLKLDFPLYKTIPQQLTAQNKQLQQKFAIRSFPTLVIIDPNNQQQIGTTGYRPGGGKQYAEHLGKLTASFSAYKQKVSSLSTQMLPPGELRKMYEQAKNFEFDQDMIAIIKAGIQSDDNVFFLAENYRLLANEGLMHSQEAQALKLQIATLERPAAQLVEYEIALIEYDVLSEKMVTGHCSIDMAVSPLLRYIEKYGCCDRENLWRLEMIISQVYLDKNNFNKALQHAQASYRAAPQTIKTELGFAIKNLQSQILSLN